MSFFSRLTDIVACNLSALLAQSADPQATLAQIIREMEEGLAGARRSAQTAAGAVERLAAEIDGHRQHVGAWAQRAKDHVLAGRESDARQCLLRKREIEDLLAGLQQQLTAAEATRDQVLTTFRAVEARWHEARRRMSELSPAAAEVLTPRETVTTLVPVIDERMSQVDAELEALKRELAG